MKEFVETLTLDNLISSILVAIAWMLAREYGKRLEKNKKEKRIIKVSPSLDYTEWLIQIGSKHSITLSKEEIEEMYDTIGESFVEEYSRMCICCNSRMVTDHSGLCDACTRYIFNRETI